jgi:hypothetical protein
MQKVPSLIVVSLSERDEGFFPLAFVSRPAQAHPASIPMGTGIRFPGVKCNWGLTLTTQPHIVSKSILNRSYALSPSWHLHGSSGTALLLLFFIVLLVFQLHQTLFCVICYSFVACYALYININAYISCI